MRDGWIETTLGDVAEWWSGGTPKAREPKYYENGTIPWAVIADMNKGIINSTNSYITEDALDLIGGRLAPVGSVLISMYASVGKSAIANIPLATNQAIAWSIPNKKKIIPFYLYLVSQQLEKEISDLARGATQRNINRQMLREFTFQLPPLPEQKRIVDLISSVDSYIDALQQQLESAKRSRNAVLHELLTAGGDDWVSGIVGDISDLRYGFTESANWDPIGPKFLRITDIQDGSVDWESVPYCYISDSEKETQLLEDGDLVFARTGATTGKSFLVTNPPVSVCASYLIRLRPNQSKVNPHYLSIFFQSEDYWSQVMAGTSGSAQGGVNASKLSKLKIDLPPLSTQTEISEIIQEMDTYAFGLQKAIRKSQDLRSGLVNELLSGEHEIPSSYDKVMGAA
jgi:type I restriction enzyme S subunit